MYAHLNALVLADYLGADVMLPPSVYRESFSKYFSSTDLKKNEVSWTPEDTGALLDVEAIQAHYAQKGMTWAAMLLPRCHIAATVSLMY